MRKMPDAARDYFKYFLPPPELSTWGLGVTATGYTHLPPGAPYPPSAHPADHDFTWERGRVLEALQIVLVEAGAGTLETSDRQVHALGAGSAFIVLPRRWHRYRPAPAKGWTESWIELQGPLVRGWLRSGVFRADSVVRRGAILAGLDRALAEVHQIARGLTAGFDPELAARAYAVVVAWARMDGRLAPPTRLQSAILEAERHLAEHSREPVNVRDLAQSLGVAYSHFRRAFRQQTGYAPWQYVLHLRLTRARRLLAAGDATLDDIADRLGFSSGFHFSHAFKKAFGLSPDQLRRQLRQSPP